MNNPNITFVSAFYNIRDKEANIYRNEGDDHFCNVRTYIEASRKLFRLKSQLILFVEPNLAPAFKRIMAEENNTSTIIYEKDYDELYLMPHLNTIIENDKKYHVSNSAKEKFTPLYYLIISEKLFFVEESIRKNPFNTENFAWIDIRGLNLSPTSDEKMMSLERYLNPLGKVKICCMCYTTKQEISNKLEYYKFNRGKTAGTFFVGNKYFMTKFIDKFRQELFYTLANGLALTEEQIYGMVIGENENIFDLHYGDYQDSINNIDRLNTERSVMLCVRSFNYCYVDSSHKNVLEIGKQLIDYLVKDYWNMVNCTTKVKIDENWFNIIYRTYIGAYYTKNYTCALKCYILLLYNCIYDSLKEKKEMLKQNFTCMGDKLDEETYNCILKKLDS
jgi:hypothetical protein